VLLQKGNWLNLLTGALQHADACCAGGGELS